MTTADDAFNAAAYLLDRQLDAGRGDHPALVCQGEQVTYRELQQLTAQVAHGLRSLGVGTGDRVVLVCSDRVELAAGILGTMRSGAVAVPVSTMLTGAELAKLVDDSGAVAVLVTPEFVEATETAVADAAAVRHVVTVAGARLGVPPDVVEVTWDSLVSGGAAEDVAPTTGDSSALWLYTSGTTGMPKAAMHRHANLRAVCETYASGVLGAAPQDRFFSLAKLFFAYGLGNSLLFPLSVGATAVLEPRRPTPEVVAERLREDRPTLLFASPTSYAGMLAADLPREAFSSVRLAASAGEALPATLYRRVTERFGIEVLDGIGSTEALHIFLSNAPGAVRAGTSGQPVPGYELEVRDDDDHPVPDGTPGVLYVRGASLATGYWQRPEATADVFRDGWLRTGDTYVRDADGYYACLGRTTDLIKAGGIWVSPAEVEERLLQHPQVNEAAVVAVADADGLDKPVAFVVPVAGPAPTAEELIAWCREGLAAFKRPRAVVLVDELPKTPTGKVKRFALRDRAGADLLAPA